MMRVVWAHNVIIVTKMAETKPSDLIAAVDRQDNLVGAIRRSDIAQSPYDGFRTAHVIVRDRSGRVMLQRLAARRKRNPCKLGSSVAAYVRAGESYIQAARRRLNEELGLDTSLTLIGKTAMRDFGHAKHIAVFETTVNPETPENLEPGHIAELVWIDAEDLTRSMRADPQAFTETFLCIGGMIDVDARPSA